LFATAVYVTKLFRKSPSWVHFYLAFKKSLKFSFSLIYGSRGVDSKQKSSTNFEREKDERPYFKSSFRDISGVIHISAHKKFNGSKFYPF